MMTKDGTKTDEAVATIARAGADAVTADKRHIVVSAWYGDASNPTEARVPYLFDGNGTPRPCSEAIDLAKQLHLMEHPRRVGTYKMDDLASLIAWGQRFQTPTTAAFITAPEHIGDGSVVVVIDEMAPAGHDGALRQLRCNTTLRLHERLQAWLSASTQAMNIEQFSDFAQRATDEFAEASLISAIANVEVHEESKWVRSVDSETGTVKLTAESSKRTTKMPTSFQFAVPVFDGDDPQNAMTFTARLVIKAPNGKPQFQFEVVDFKPRLAQAMETIRQQVLAVTPNVYMGSPG